MIGTLSHGPRQQVPPNLADALSQHGLLQLSDVLCLTSLDLMDILNITHSEAQSLLLACAAVAAPPFTIVASALQASCLQEAAALHTGLPALDDCFQHRGLPRGVITELVGPSSAGKSQACMTLSFLAAAPAPIGMGRHVIYIDTEGKFNGPRMAEIAHAR